MIGFKRIVIVAAACVFSACATYQPPGESQSSAELHFELLTSTRAGGGHLAIGVNEVCDVQRNILGFSKGAILPGRSEYQAKIHANVSNTVRFRIIDGKYNCGDKIVFTPEQNASYYVTFEYHLPGCKLELYELKDGDKEIIKHEKC